MSRMSLPFVRAADQNNDPVPGALVYFYAAGTTTPKATYSNRELTTVNANPVVCDSGGYPQTEIWLGDGLYKVVITDADGAAISGFSDLDNFTVGGGEDLTAIKSSVGNTSGTNYATAIEADFIRAAALGVDTIVHGKASSTIYGRVSGQDTIELDLGEYGSIQGINNLRGDQRRMVGCSFYNPTLTVSTPFQTNNTYYRHQPAIGLGLLKGDNTRDLIAICQGHPTERGEGRDGQKIYMAVSTNAGVSWGSEYTPFDSATYTTNPYDYTAISGNSKGDRTLWRGGLLNLQIAGIADQLVAKWSTGRFATRNGLFLPVMTTAGGLWTNRHLWFADSDGTPLLSESLTAPVGYSQYMQYEGYPARFPICHDMMLTHDGRALFAMISSPLQESSQVIAKDAFVMWTDNLGADNCEDIIWNLGPSIPLADFDPNNLWEWSIAQEDTNLFKAKFRRNEKATSSVVQLGHKFGTAYSNDGITWSAVKWEDDFSQRTRAYMRPLNHVHNVAFELAHPLGRSVGQLAFARKNGGLARGVAFSNESVYTKEEDTFNPAGASDSIWTGIGIALYTNGNRFEHYRGGSDGLTDTLDQTGWVAATGTDMVSFNLPESTEIDSLVITEGRSWVELLPTSAGQSIFDSGLNLTTAPQVTLVSTANDFTTLASSLFTWNSTTDKITIAGSTGVATLAAEHAPKRHVAATFTHADTISLGFDLDDTTDLEVGMVVDDRLDSYMDKQDVTLKVGSAEATFYTDLASGDRITLRQRSGELVQVPTGEIDPENNRYYAIWGTSNITVNTDGGGTDIKCTRIDGPPNTDDLMFVANSAARAYYGDAGHAVSYDSTTTKMTISGSADVMASLDRKAMISFQKLQLSAAPGGTHPRPILGVAGTNHFCELQMDVQSGAYTLQVREIKGRGIDNNVSPSFRAGRPKPIKDPTALFGASVFVDPENKVVEINGVQVRMAPPYSLYVGEHLFYKEDPLDTAQTLSFWLNATKQTYLDDNFPHRGPIPENPLAPNLFINPGFRLDPVKGGNNYTQTALNKTTVPPWALRDDGGVTLRITRNNFSTNAASSRMGWRYAMSVTVASASSNKDSFVRIVHPWRDVQSIMGGVFFCGVLVNNYDYAAEDLSPPSDGVVAHIEWVQKFGDHENITTHRLETIRISTEQRRFELPLFIPDPYVSQNRTVNPYEDWCGFQLAIETLQTCTIRCENFDLYRGDGPRDWTAPSEVEDWQKLAPYWQWMRSREDTNVLFHSGYRASAAQGRYVWEFPVRMAKPPILVSNGSFNAVNQGGTASVSSLSTIRANEQRIEMGVNGLTAISTQNEAQIFAVSNETLTYTADGVQNVFTIPDSIGVLMNTTTEADRLTVYRDTGAGTLTLTYGTANDYLGTESYEKYNDGPFTGDGVITAFTQNYSIAASSQIDVIHNVDGTLMPETDYTVTAGESGVVVLTTALTSGNTIRTQHRSREHSGYFITLLTTPDADDIVSLVPTSASDAWIAADAYIYPSDVV